MSRMYVGGWLRSSLDLRWNSDEQSLTRQVDFGWALWKTQRATAFSQKAKIYLLDVCWAGEETIKTTASNVTPQISSLRDDTGQKCYLRLRLIEQQIAPYFSRSSAVTKVGLMTRSLFVSMNEDEEADADNLASAV